MMRLLRITLRAGAMLSLLVCASATVLWIRSYLPAKPEPVSQLEQEEFGSPPYRSYIGDHGAFTLGGNEYRWSSRRGEFDLNNDLERLVLSLETGMRFCPEPSARSKPPRPPVPPAVRIHFHYSAVLLGSLVLPLTWLILSRRKPARPPGMYCRICGYDLRATPQRCPECGTIAHDPPPAS